jgi:hypothetical protein
MRSLDKPVAFQIPASPLAASEEAAAGNWKSFKQQGCPAERNHETFEVFAVAGAVGEASSKNVHSNHRRFAGAQRKSPKKQTHCTGAALTKEASVKGVASITTSQYPVSWKSPKSPTSEEAIENVEFRLE